VAAGRPADAPLSLVRKPGTELTMPKIQRQIARSGTATRGYAILLAMLAATANCLAAAPAPAPGMFLVASRSLVDGNFAGTVVLLTRYSADGAMGLVVNRPVGVGPDELITDIDNVKNYQGELHGGGPVAIHNIFMLIRSDQALQSAQHVFADVYASHSRDLLESLPADHFSREVMRFYAGYAGWGAGQLNAEIARGDWHLVAATTEAIFGNDSDQVWKKLLPPPAAIIAAHDSLHRASIAR